MLANQCKLNLQQKHYLPYFLYITPRRFLKSERYDAALIGGRRSLDGGVNYKFKNETLHNAFFLQINVAKVVRKTS